MIFKLPASVFFFFFEATEYFVKTIICEVQSRKQTFKNRGCNEVLEPCFLAFRLTCWGDESLLQANNKGDEGDVGIGGWKR